MAKGAHASGGRRSQPLAPVDLVPLREVMSRPPQATDRYPDLPWPPWPEADETVTEPTPTVELTTPPSSHRGQRAVAAVLGSVPVSTAIVLLARAIGTEILPSLGIGVACALCWLAAVLLNPD